MTAPSGNEPRHEHEDQTSAYRLAALTVATVALVVLVVFGTRLLAPPTGSASPGLPLWVLGPVAYLGGVLALLSPCSGAILPAFFAYSFQSQGELVRGTYVFYLGLALVFVPVGGASALVQSFVVGHASVVFAVAGALLVLLGVVALVGFDLGRLTRPLGLDPSTVGQDRLHEAARQDTRTYLMGALFGFATSSCTAPILGSLVAVTIGTGLTVLAGVGLFLVFALGIVTPLFVLAWAFEDSRWMDALQGADPVEVRLAGRTHAFHPVHLASGGMLIALGVLFIATRGTLDLVNLYTRYGLADAYEELNLAIQSFAKTATGKLLAVAIAISLLLLAWGFVRRVRARADGSRTE